jgi:hypothetical protein
MYSSVIVPKYDVINYIFSIVRVYFLLSTFPVEMPLRPENRKPTRNPKKMHT